MNKNNKKIMVTFFIVALGVVAIVAIGALRQKMGKNLFGVMNPRVKGNEKAPLKITEFIDFQCPACARGSIYLKKLIQDHPDLIRLELKYFPLRMHKHGELSSFYAECAARQGLFWPMHDLLIERQDQWKDLANAEPVFKAMTQQIKLETQKLESCLKDEAVTKVIQTHKDEGGVLGVRSTPTYFVNGEMVVGSNNLTDKINAFLKEKGGNTP